MNTFTTYLYMRLDRQYSRSLLFFSIEQKIPGTTLSLYSEIQKGLLMATVKNTKLSAKTKAFDQALLGTGANAPA